jgi:outer membrane biosynthesis protein TonB
MLRISIFLIAMVSLLIFSVSNATEVILEDTPNAGDTTTITTITSGNPASTGNLVSQDFDDGSWIGTMFPDSSDINESTWLTGKDGKYAETSIDSDDHLSLEELQLGFTSTFGAQIRWWNPVESTVTLTQTATNGVDTTTQSTTFHDTTNHNYQTNPYSNQLTLAPDPQNQHGTLTVRFSFDIQGNKNYNGGHAGVDVRDPVVTVDYNTLSTTTSTSVVYCWQKNPPTCPGQDEIEDVQEQLEQFEMIEFTIPEDIFMEPPPEIEYTFNPVFEEEIEIVEEFNIIPMDEFFFEDDYYQDVIVEEYIPMDVVAIEELDWNDSNVEFFDELPPLEMFEELPPMEEVYMEEIVLEEMFAEEFTEEMQEEFIEEVFEVYEEVVVEAEPEPAPEPEIVEEVAMVEEKPAMEEVKEEPIEEEIVDEEIAEQPSSEEVVADEPAPAAEIAKQEEAIEEPTQEQPSSDVEVDLDIKVAAIEKAIQSKIKNEMQRVSVTLDVINEIVSREMTSTQADISSYFDTNAALFDTRQIPGGDPAFFMQASLASYDKTIYATQASIAGTDPIVQHQIKMREHKKKTSDAYRNLMELLNARNVQ